ncbi:Hsp70 family protein [Romeria aff. gracilis LEGE 07310]|uniref:Hsp70 family protein n=1 Tax=Vasconcelosia minhoensis LEGE 07310 TaxID=915328 RepID=A0A8J7DPT3_9CYAN|nr:Hsp70 family protein [Romeria gracilis]MBE9080255.1 Hsp70 family protein [Romeria aff. gracilis LEGE 07310]
MTLAIDFGTSNTVVARWNAATQQPEILALDPLAWQFGANPPLIPSLLYVEDAAQGKTVAGQGVRDRGLDIASDSRFFRNFKRGIGSSVQGFMPELDGQLLNFEQVGRWFLTQVIQQVRVQEPDLNSLVFTVPVDSFEAYRHWLGQLCQTLEIDQVRMLDEPTAAALGYQLSGNETILVLDFGGGTLDLSLVQLTTAANRQPLGFILKWGQKTMAEESAQRPKTARVLAKAGENLGGADIDHWLADYFAAQQGVPVSALTLRLAEKLKIQLSQQSEASEAYFNDETLESYELNLDRKTFNEILTEQGFFQRLDDRLTQLLQQARRQGIESSNIDAVLLVGGTAQIPAVQEWIGSYFESDKIRRDRPFEAIAQGALQLRPTTELQDFLYHSYGVRYWDRRHSRHSWHAIIPQGQAYPMTEPVELVLGASSNNQPSIELILGEMGDAATRTEVYFESDRLITRRIEADQAQVQPLNDRDGARTIAQLTPPGFPGSDRVRVQFWIDRDRFLRITVEDILTSATLLRNQAVVQLT